MNGRAPELFTDNASKARKFKQLLSVLVCTAMPLFIMIVVSDKQRVMEQLSLPSLVILGAILAGYFLIMPYSVLRLLGRVRELK